MGPGDGTSPFPDNILNTVDDAVTGEALWVNSDGNMAERTWFSDDVTEDSFTTSVSQQFLFFDQADSDPVNGIYLFTGQQYHFQLRWEGDWPSADIDLTFSIWTIDENNMISSPPLASSGEVQDGSDTSYPFDYFSFTPPMGGTYLLPDGDHSRLLH